MHAHRAGKSAGIVKPPAPPLINPDKSQIPVASWLLLSSFFQLSLRWNAQISLNLPLNPAAGSFLSILEPRTLQLIQGEVTYPADRCTRRIDFSRGTKTASTSQRRQHLPNGSLGRFRLDTAAAVSSISLDLGLRVGESSLDRLSATGIIRTLQQDRRYLSNAYDS